MILPRIGDRYPLDPRGTHGDHEARIVAVDTGGAAEWDEPLGPPIVTVRCSCGFCFVAILDEVAA